MSTNPFNNCSNGAALVNQSLGEAYDVIKEVYENLAKIIHVSDNMQAVFTVNEASDALVAFQENPALLDLLTNAADDLATVSTTYAALLSNTPKFDNLTNRFLNWTALGPSAPMIKQIVISGTSPVAGSTEYYNLPVGVTNSKILNYQVLVHCDDSTVRTLEGLGIAFFNENQLRIAMNVSASIGTNVAFTCLITYTDS